MCVYTYIYIHTHIYIDRDRDRDVYMCMFYGWVCPNPIALGSCRAPYRNRFNCICVASAPTRCRGQKATMPVVDLYTILL